MNNQAHQPLSPKDRLKVHSIRKQVIQCEAIIRKALSIYNCINDLQKSEENCIHYNLLLSIVVKDTKIDARNEKERCVTDTHSSSSVSTRTFENQSNGHIEGENESIPYKPASSHLSTPVFSRSSNHYSTPIVSQLKPASSHVSTPIPLRKHSSLPVKRSSSASETSFFSPTVNHQDCSSSCFV